MKCAAGGVGDGDRIGGKRVACPFGYQELRALKIVPQICWILCYNIAVHLKVEGPKKPRRGTIGNDADLLAGNLRWSYGDESVNPLGRRAVVAGAIQPAGK